MDEYPKGTGDERANCCVIRKARHLKPETQIRQLSTFPLKFTPMIQTEPAPKSTRHRLAALPFGLSITAPAVLFLAVFITVFSLYAFTLAPGVVGGDAGEHQFAVPLLGIPHTTGYPLYVLTGKLWTLLLPVGSMAWRMNLFSALGGALAAATTSLVVYHLSSSGTFRVFWPGAVTAGVALAFGLTLWQWSAIAGVRSFNVFFFALLTLQAIRWANLRQQEQLTTQNSELSLRWLALAIGLSLAHHRTTVFYLPSLIGWVWWHDRQLLRQPRRLAMLTLLTVTPLLLYLFIYLRGINQPPYTHEPIYDLQSFWFLVGSGDSTGLFLSLDLAYLPARLGVIWGDILNQLSWPGVILAMAGGLLLLWRHPKHFIFQGLLVALLLLFTLDFEVVNLNEAPTWYLMPVYFIFAVWLGIAVNGILSFVIRHASRSFVRLRGHSSRFAVIQTAITILILILLTFSLGRPNWQTQYATATAPLDDWRQLLRGTQAQRFVESSLPLVEPHSIIWGDWEQYTPIKYYQFINGLRPDVTARNPLNDWPQKVAAAHAAGQPVYLARKPPDLIGARYLSMVGPLIHVGSKPRFQAPTGIIQLNANFEDELNLIGYRAQIFPQDTQTEPVLQLMLYWRVPQKVQWDYALSLRLIDPLGQEIYKKDASHPVLSSYPTSLWTPGEVVGDFYELPLPVEAGPLTLHLLPYRTEGPGQWHNLTLSGADPPQEGIKLGPFSPLAGQK